MIISLHHSAKHITTRPENTVTLLAISNGGHLLTHFLLESNLSLQNKTNSWQDEWIRVGYTGRATPQGTKSPDY